MATQKSHTEVALSCSPASTNSDDIQSALWPRQVGREDGQEDCFQVLQRMVAQKREHARKTSASDGTPQSILIKRSASISAYPTAATPCSPPSPSGLRRTQSVRFTSEPPKIFNDSPLRLRLPLSIMAYAT